LLYQITHKWIAIEGKGMIQAIVTIFSTAILGVLIAIMSTDDGLIISTFADTSGPLKFCFTTTDPVVTGACSQSFGACKKNQDNFVSNGYTIAISCHKV
jgi:hypothetical protein